MSLHTPETDDRDGLDPDETASFCHNPLCGGLLPNVPGEYIEFSGWLWCVDCGREMQRLAKGPDHVDQVRR
jgi:hypothetical protein